MANHVAVSIVTDHQIKLTAVDRFDQFVGDFWCAHLWLQIVGCHFWRSDQNAGLVIPWLLATTAEEEGHVGILLGFSNAQLGFAKAGHVLTQSVVQLRRREGTWCRNASCVAGQHHESGQFRTLLQGKAIKALVGKHVGQLTGTVGTEVHENQGVAIFDERRLSTFWHDHSWLHELVVFVTGVGRFQTFHGALGSEFAFASSQQVPSQLNTIPTAVTIQRVVTTDDAGDTAHTQLVQQGIGFLKGRLSATGWHITAIEEGMNVDFFGTTVGRHLNHRHDVIFVGVHTTGGEQTHQVHSFAVANRGINSLDQLRIGLEFTIFDRFGDTGQVLINHATSTQVHVTNFAVTHLAFWQTNIATGTGYASVGVAFPHTIHVRGFGRQNGVGISFIT